LAWEDGGLFPTTTTLPPPQGIWACHPTPHHGPTTSPTPPTWPHPTTFPYSRQDRLNDLAFKTWRGMSRTVNAGRVHGQHHALHSHTPTFHTTPPHHHYLPHTCCQPHHTYPAVAWTGYLLVLHTTPDTCHTHCRTTTVRAAGGTDALPPPPPAHTPPSTLPPPHHHLTKQTLTPCPTPPTPPTCLRRLHVAGVTTAYSCGAKKRYRALTCWHIWDHPKQQAATLAASSPRRAFHPCQPRYPLALRAQAPGRQQRGGVA